MASPTARSALVAAAAGAAGALAGWYQLLRRPLPITRGSIAVRALDGRVTIERDRLGVPRITAGSTADLCFGEGFCHGQDRSWQLEFYRRVAAGRAAELGGEDGLVVDRLMRTLGLRRAAEQELGRLPARSREMLEAYAAGLDAARAAAAAPPLELQLLRVRPEPWSPADSLAIGKILGLGFSSNMETELFLADLIRRIGPEKAARLVPGYPAGNPVVMQPGVPWEGDVSTMIEQLGRVREAIGLTLELAGSNAWAVSGERSATGKPLLAGDPHISSTIPDVWYAVELHGPRTDLRGASMPGFPGVMIGQSPSVAWSFTNVLADVEDLFVERLREAPGGGREYEFEGEWLPLKVHREEIAVSGRSQPELLEVLETHHGPIVNDALGAGAGSEPLALAWTALREPFFVAAMVETAGIERGPDMVEAVRDFSVPCMNMVWADSSGGIGYKLVGKLPLRRGGCPDLPRPGWTGEHEWDGYVPYEELPAFENPPGGAIVSANNRVAPLDFPHHVTSEPLDGYRAARIEQLLAERPRHDLQSFERIQSDLLSIPGELTAHRLARLRPAGQREVRAIERLKSWDHRLDPDTVAGTIYEVFTVHFAQAVSEAVVGDPDDAARWRSKSLLGFSSMTTANWRFQAHLLELWDEADPELIGGRSWDELALEALGSALDELEDRFGHDPTGWRWGRVHGVKFWHALGQGTTPVSKLLDRLLSRRLPAGGGQETVCQIGFAPQDGDYTGEWGPAYRLLADLGDPARSRWQHMTGQSGHPGSPHYDDLLDDWLAGRSNPVGLPAVDTLTLEPRPR